jgi:two-component system chemotaxis response regulator CheY
MSKQVLVVDDSATVRQQVRLALSPAGFEILEARDGRQGLEQIRSNPALCCVICDINMPSMNGIEMIQVVARERLRPDLPIVMLTTEGQPSLIRAAKAAGAKGWIVKPFKPDLLVAAITRLAA